MLFSSQRVQSKAAITTLMSILGALAAGVFAIAIPSVYYAISINRTQHTLAIEAAFLAKSIEKIIMARPDLWEFESVRLTELISQPSVQGKADERKLLTAAGKLVTKNTLIEPRYIFPEFGIGSRACARKKINNSLRKKKPPVIGDVVSE